MKNLCKGITLVEVIVVVFIIAMFSAILISDFPKIRRQFALSRATYKFSQDMRRTQDMALSGAQLESGGQARGYGIYVDLADNKKYIIYADTFVPNDNEYTAGSYPAGDYIVDTVDISQEEKGVIIKEINHVNYSWVSVDFAPPNPTTTITSLSLGEDNVEVIFALEVDQSITRIVSVNTSGLVEVK